MEQLQHPTIAEREYIEEMKTRLDLKHGPVDELLVLAQLQIEPLHKEVEAITTLEFLLMRDRCNSWAVYWLAYCFLHYLMDNQALQRARLLIESHLANCTIANGALYAILAEILDDLNAPWRLETNAEHESRSSEILLTEVALLQQSVLLEPDWVSNRLSLAWALERLGRIEEAIAQLCTAQQKVVPASASWDMARYYFEVLVTGRIGDGIEGRIAHWLARLRTEET